MLKVFKFFISFVFFGISIGLPIKDQEIDELIYRLQELKHQSRYNGGNDEIITNQIHDDYGPRSWDALFGYQNRIDDIGLRNVQPYMQPYFGNVVRRSMKQVDRLGGGMLLRPSDPFAGSIGDGIPNNTPEEAEETIRNVNGQNGVARGTDRIQLRSLDHIGGGNLLKRSLDHIGGGNLLKRSLDSIGGGHLLKRAVDSIGGGYLLNKSNLHPIVDLERKPLLYDYYANTLNPVTAKRFDEIDRVGMVGLQGKRNFDEIDRSGLTGFHGKRNFDEIDRSGFSGFQGKRNFDEIDRSGISGLHKRSIDNSERYYMTTGPNDINSSFGEFLNRYYNEDRDVVKRNFDEIDRFGPGGFLKRNFQRQLDEISRLGARGSQFTKKNFDEIDRFGFTGLKRSEKFTVPKMNN